MNDSSDGKGHRERLRRRFIRTGIQSFSDHELVELLLTLAIPRRDVKKPAKALIARYRNLRGILDASREELQEVKGLGKVAPVALKLIRETANLYLQQQLESKPILNSSEGLETFWRSRLGGMRHEVFEVAFLDGGYRLLPDGIQRMQEGTVDRAAVYPRRIIEETLRKGAAAIVLAHNHTNSNVTPSEQDKIITQAIVQAAMSVQIKIVDHLIIADQNVFSFRQAGLL